MNANKNEFSFLTEERFKIIQEKFKNNRIAVENGNHKKEKVKIRQTKLEEFKELWEAINRKSKIVYKGIEEDFLIEKVAINFNKTEIKPIIAEIITKEYNSQKDEITNKKTETQAKVVFFKDGDYGKFIDSFITGENNLKLPLSFMLKLLNKIDMEKVKNNPKKSKRVLEEDIKNILHESLLQKIDYEFENTIKITSLQNEDGKYLKEIEASSLGRNVEKETEAPKHLLYDKIVWDSKIEKEAQENDPEKINDNEIVVFAKLPRISIPTPYKNYNPDFAYLIKRANGKQLFLVVETKGYDREDKISLEEKEKINYAKKFFKSLQKELPDVEIRYKTRINKQDLSSILNDIEKGE